MVNYWLENLHEIGFKKALPLEHSARLEYNLFTPCNIQWIKIIFFICLKTQVHFFVNSELGTHNPDCQILITTVDTFNLRINAYSLHFSYPLRIQLYCGISTNEWLTLSIDNILGLEKKEKLLKSVHKAPETYLIEIPNV